MNRYEEQLYKELDDINGFRHGDIKNLDRYPAKTADMVLKTLLEWACQPQNDTAIELGRKKILEINGNWLRLHMIRCAESCLDLSDEWEYRRFVELVVLAAPDLKAPVLALGENSENAEIRETVDDYRIT